MTIVVNVSDAKVSRDPDAVLATYALGSCVGVSLYDAEARVAGLLHFQLPTSTMDARKATANPFMFADSGMDSLLKEMERGGAQKRRMKVRLAGAAQMLNDSGLFNIGRRNHAAIRKVLWQQGMFIESEEIGGATPRTMYLRVADGSLTIKSGTESISR